MPAVECRAESYRWLRRVGSTPEKAVQFHSALLENGVESVLVTYSEEGHGIRKVARGYRYVARDVAWIQDMAATAATERLARRTNRTTLQVRFFK